MRLAAELPDIRPGQADARIEPIYEDIQQTLRVPFVNLIFRTLANYPDYLEAAWRQLGPMLRMRAFEEAADALRAQALLDPPPGAPEDGWTGIRDLDRLRAFNDTIHYVLPKLLLIATALHETASGRSSQAAGPSGGLASWDTIPPGVAKGASKVQMIDPGETSGPLQDLFERIKARHGHPLVSSYYRGLGNWPDFLRSAWSEIEPRVGSIAYEERKRLLVEQALAVVQNLPEAGPQAEARGSREQEIQAILAAFRFKFIPEMLIDVSLIKAMLDGTDEATSSPFSA